MVATGAVEIAAVTGMPATGQRADTGSDDSAFAQLLGDAVSDDTVAAAPATTPGTTGNGKPVKAAVATDLASPATPGAEILALLGLPVMLPANTPTSASTPVSEGALADRASVDQTTDATAGAATAAATMPAQVLANATTNAAVVSPQKTQSAPVSTPTTGIDPAGASVQPQAAAVPATTHAEPVAAQQVPDRSDDRASAQAADLQWLQRGVRGATQDAPRMDVEVAATTGTEFAVAAGTVSATPIHSQATHPVVPMPAQQVAGHPDQQPVKDATAAIEPTVVPDNTFVTPEQQPVMQNTLMQATPMLGLMNAQLREAGFDRSPRDVALSDVQNILGPLNASTLQPAGTQLASDAPLFDVAPRHHLQATVGTQQWATELGNKLTMMATKDTQSATLYMTPADLGPVQVRIDLSQEQASVWFTAEHAETRSALEQSLPKLRELFAAQGMSLTDAGVFGDRSRQQQTDSGFTSSRFHNMQYEDSEALADTATVRTISLGLLDAYA